MTSLSDSSSRIATALLKSAILAVCLSGCAHRNDIFDLAYAGDIVAMQEMLIRSPSAVDQTERGFTPLHFAAARGHLAAVELLIDNGAPVDAQADGGYEPIHAAANAGHRDVVANLVARGADINTAYIKPAKGALEQTIMSDAIYLNNVAMVQLALKLGADVDLANSRGWTPLHLAAHQNRGQICERLMTHNASINARNSRSETPLMLAAIRGHHEVMKLLLWYKANPNQGNDTGTTPLHVAARYGDADIAKTLLERGANVNARTKQGETPLFWASEPETVAMLKAYGGHLEPKD